MARATLGESFDWMDLWLEQIRVSWEEILSIIIQFSILVGCVYLIYSQFIKGSTADRLLKGLFVVFLLFIILWALANKFGLLLLESVFGSSIQLLLFGLLVVFQPELRRILLYLGQSELFSLNKSHLVTATEDSRTERLIEQLVESARYLSKSKTGALIVLEPESYDGDAAAYLESGTKINALVSTELLLTVFHTNTPLHDGAVVINKDNRLAAAGVLLPLTEDPTLSWRYGTRHRAALGLTELVDSACIVVSEETGTISYVRGGRLEKLSKAEELIPYLETLYQVSTTAKSGMSAEGSSRVRELGDRFGSFFKTKSIQRIFNRNKSGPSRGKRIKDLSVDDFDQAENS